MLKKLSVLALILVIAACQSKTRSSDQKPLTQDGADTQIIDNQIIEPESFQTLESEKQAQAMNEGQIVREVEVQDRVFFDYNSSEVNETSRPILDTQAQWLRSSPSIKITIEGHCDERGTREYNIALGEKRAVAVKNYLEKNGVDTSRMQVVSYGKERPAYFGSKEDVYAKNRRAVIIVN